MKKALRWGRNCAFIGAALGIVLSIMDNLLLWPPTTLTPLGVKYLIGSIAVPALFMFLLGVGAGLVWKTPN
ncbi:hypothetical protein [Acidocella sp.]|uniref:hypothetical protein n=1 Tax=Acidocella sp. TaxID=50710 RepID=UPI002632DE2C|nr:hypothetical protein [Acidocella sp.]